MPSRAYTSLLPVVHIIRIATNAGVSMPSRAYTSLLRSHHSKEAIQETLCQCPHGLIPHCYLVDVIRILRI